MSRRDVLVGGVGRWAAPAWLRDPAARGRALVVLVALPVLAALGAATALLPPLLVGAGVAGVLLFLLVLLNVRLALLLYVATAVNLAAIPLPVDLPFAVTPDIVLTLVLTVAVLVQFAVRPQALAALPVTRLYLAFLALTLITMPLSPELLVGFKVWVRYVSYLVIAAAILAEIRQSRDVRLFFIAFVGSALVPMAVGLYQFLTVTGEVISLPNFQQVVRLKATTGGSFTYAFYLTLVLAMALPVVHVKRLSRRYRLLLLAVLGAAVASLLLTYIRGAWLALAVALLILGVLRLRYLLLAAPAGIAALVFLADFVRRRLASSLSATDTGFERLHLWRQAWDHFLDSPVVGKGCMRSRAHSAPCHRCSAIA
ncbi:MAG: O-antigen ligase family protein [Dehalococcoidia bacterium]